jgi:hypothetical protein
MGINQLYYQCGIKGGLSCHMGWVDTLPCQMTHPTRSAIALDLGDRAYLQCW